MKRLISAAIAASSMLAASALGSMPAGNLTSLTFRITGGMRPFDKAYYHLRTDDDGVRRLTVNGSSPGETITFEVADSVFTRCRDIIEQTRLYKADGFYKSEFIVHDAPSKSFSATFVNPANGKRATVSASGFYPQEIGSAISVVTDYLRSLVGDRKAPGHLERLADDKVPSGLTFVDGELSFSPADGKIEDVCRHYCERFGIDDYHAPSWSSQFVVDNDGNTYMVVQIFYKEIYAVLPQRDVEPAHPVLPLMQGRYTDTDGKQYLITRDGRLKHNDGDDGTPLRFLRPDIGTEDVLVEMDDVIYRVMLTDDGLNLYRRHKNSGTPRTVTYDTEPLRLTMDVSAGNEAGIPGRWHVAALYPLQLSTLQLLPRDVLNILSCEADARATSTFRNAELSAYFLSKSWYKPDRLERINFPISDTEQLNQYACRIFYGPFSNGYHPYE